MSPLTATYPALELVSKLLVVFEDYSANNEAR